MATAKLYNLARMSSATVGTGTITLGSAVSGYLTFALAGVANGDVVSYGIKDGSNSEVGTGTYTSAGTTLTRTVTVSTNSNTAISLSGSAEVFVTARAEDIVDASILQNFLAGLGTANSAGDPTNDIDIAVGAAADSTNLVLMKLTSAITKQLDAAWAVGTNAGGRMSAAAIANTTYHVWLIQRSDTGVVDVGFDVSASAPTMPTNYDRKRLIWSFNRASATITPYTQVGNECILTTGTHDINNQNVGTTATTYTLASIPTGVIVTAKGAGSVFAAAATSIANFYPILVTDQSVAYGAFANVRDTSAGNGAVVQLAVLTNTSGQIRARGGSAGATIDFYVTGWTNTRGQ